MDPSVYGYCIGGGVPGLHLPLEPGHQQLLQNVFQYPVRQEGLPDVQEFNHWVAVSRRPIGECLSQLWHKHLPDQAVIRVHPEQKGGVVGSCIAVIDSISRGQLKIR